MSVCDQADGPEIRACRVTGFNISGVPFHKSVLLVIFLGCANVHSLLRANVKRRRTLKFRTGVSAKLLSFSANVSFWFSFAPVAIIISAITTKRLKMSRHHNGQNDG